MFAKRIQSKFGEKGTLGGMLADVKISGIEFGSLAPKFSDITVKIPTGETHNPNLVCRRNTKWREHTTVLTLFRISRFLLRCHRELK